MAAGSRPDMTAGISSAHNYFLHHLSAGLIPGKMEIWRSFENRCRFPLEVIDEIRKNMPGRSVDVVYQN